MPIELTALFSPRSIAVIGASKSPEKLSHVILKNIVDSKYDGKVWAVNKNVEDIGKTKCFPDVASLPETPDLAIIVIPATSVSEVLDQCGQKGIKNAVVISAGFKEVGGEGAQLEKKLEEISKKHQINLLGPNCLGFVNQNANLNTTFARVSNQPGNLRFISQSGAIAASIFDWAESKGLGFNEFITLGNKTTLNENHVLEYFLNKSGSVTTLLEDAADKVQPIGMYLESISDGSAFINIAKKISAKDPIFILKPGKTKAAASAMQSHTGAIAGADDVLETALEQSGVLRCRTLEDFFDIAKAFSWENMPSGPRVAVVSNAGGPAVISADSITENGLTVAEFDEQTKKRLSEVLPRSASIFDPVDVMGDALADRYTAAMEIILQTGSCDALLVILTPQIVTQVEKTAEAIGQISRKYKKPIFCSFIGGNLVAEGEKILNKYKIPSYPYPERAIYAISAMWKFHENQQKRIREVQDINVLNTQLLPENVTQIIKNATTRKQHSLDNLEANTVVEAVGIPTPPTILAENLQQAEEFAVNKGFPVVLKLSSPGLLHKKHIGGVILDIRNKEQLAAAWETLTRKLEYLEPSIKENVKFQIQKEVPSDIEVIVGVKHDATFGSVLLFGAGGSVAELISDKNLHLLPIDKNEAKELVENSKIFNLLKGSENEPPHALEKLYDVIVNLAQLARSTPEISEIEVNPVVVTLNDVWALDTKVILQSEKEKPAGPKFRTAVTLSAELLTDKIRLFEFEMEEPLEFTPGQYISVKVCSTRLNCYSIAGQPTPNRFNLLVDSTPGGPGSKFFEALKTGDKITYLGPFGNFKLNLEDGSKKILFCATGTGVAPLRLMLNKALESKKDVYLYIGTNNFEEVFSQNYFEEIAKKHKNFKYQFAVKNPHEKWSGAVGFINDLIKKDHPDARDCSAYLCGSPLMIEAATKILLENGCPQDRIYSEKY